MRLLVLTDKYFPTPYANALCAQELIRVWKKQGHIVEILAYEDFNGNPTEWEGNTVHYVRPDIRLRSYYYADANRKNIKGKVAKYIANILSKSWGLLVLPWQPFYSFIFPRRIYKKLEILASKKKYDAIVAIFQPIDSNIAACKFKKKHQDIPYIVFCVDMLKKALVQKYLGDKIADGFFWEKRMLEKCDAFFYMHARKEDYALPRYKYYRTKLIETDLPRFKIKDCTLIPKYDFKENAEHWVYAGSIGGIHYAADRMIEIFNQISNETKRILHLFTRGAEADRIETMAKQNHWNIMVHGYVDAIMLERVMASADVIVSLKTSDQISAKIFECMSYGKPMIHFSGLVTDPNVKYFQKYTLGHVVKMYEDMETEVRSLLSYLEEKNKYNVRLDDLKEVFRMSTPEYSAEKILECIIAKQQRNNRNS